jgi:hypothetical protein
MLARYIPRYEVDKRHAAAAALRSPAARGATPHAPTPDALPQPQANVYQVLNFGDVRYIKFRRSMFVIPIVPYKLGMQVSDTYIRTLVAAAEVLKPKSPESQVEAKTIYYAGLATLARLLWSHIYPASRLGRILRHLRLARNPFKFASEVEVRQLTDFFLQCRTMSSVLPISGEGSTDLVLEPLMPLMTSKSSSPTVRRG